MTTTPQPPVTRDEAELIFRLLDVITSEIHRLYDSGMVLDESVDDYELEKLRGKISQKQGEMARLRQMLVKTRAYIARRKSLERKRHSK